MSLNISITPHVTPPVTPEPVEPEPVELPPLWMHLDDTRISNSSWGGGIRPCAPCPAVWVIKDDPHAKMNRQWQYFIRGMNYNMDLEDAYLLLDYKLAFANFSGFREPGDPKADYFHNKDLSANPPSLDKVRTCSRSTLTGTVGYSLMVALANVKDLILGASRLLPRTFRSLRDSLIQTNVLNVDLLDTRYPPPLKPGASYPQRIQDVSKDIYKYMPETHPWYFLTANIVNKSGSVVQFPRGGLYGWTEDNTPRSFMPHCADHRYGPFQVPLNRLLKVDKPPRPYQAI